MPCASVGEINFRHCRSSHEIHKFRYINDLLAVVKTLVASCLNAMRSRFSEPCGFWSLQALQADPLRDGHRQAPKIRNPAPAVTSAYCMTSFAARGVHTFASLPDDGRLCAACVKLGPGFRGGARTNTRSTGCTANTSRQWTVTHAHPALGQGLPHLPHAI